MITGMQMRAAMGLLGWTLKDLQRKTGLGSTVLNGIKACDGIKPNAEYRTLEKISIALSEGIRIRRKTIAPADLPVFDMVTAPLIKSVTVVSE